MLYIVALAIAISSTLFIVLEFTSI